MEKYTDMRDRHQQDWNSFPMFYAFSNAQFDEGMKKIGLDPSDTDKIYRFGSLGGFYRKEEGPRLKEMINKHHEELETAFEDDNFLFDAINYELGNHEFIITYDPRDALESLGLTERAEKDDRVRLILRKAMNAQQKWAEENGW